ncbi:MAG: ABC transporter substrate-binding protein [Burkholderiales bacterium]
MKRSIIDGFSKVLRAGAVAAAAALASSVAVAADTIKVALIIIDSGPFAPFMRSVVDPAKLAVDLLNAQGGAAGKKFELVIQSHAGTPAAAVAAATRAVQQEGAEFVMGWMTSSIGLALGPRMAGMNAVVIDPVSNAADITGKGCQPNYFRTSSNEIMVGNAIRAMLKRSGAKTWSVLAADYAAGHGFSKQVNAAVAEHGDTMQQTLFAPLGTTDFGSFISQLSAKPTEGLAVSIFGSDAIALAKQQQQFGLFTKYKTVVSWGFTDEITVGAQGDSTVGVYSTQSWSSTLPGAKVAAFTQAFEGRYQRRPNYVEADVFATFELLQAAANKAGSADVAAVRTALNGLKMNGILGDVEMRGADHQLVRPIVVVQIVKGPDGKGVAAVRSVEPGLSVSPTANPECKLPS